MPHDAPPVSEESLELLAPVRLGTVGRGAILIFTVPATSGFIADASLECENRLVAKWDSEELVGRETQEVLQPVGLYTLSIVISYTMRQETAVELAFEVVEPNSGNAPRRERLLFQGKAPGLHRATVFIRVFAPRASHPTP